MKRLEALFNSGYTSKARLWAEAKRLNLGVLKREVDAYIDSRKGGCKAPRNNPGTKGYHGINRPWQGLSIDVFVQDVAGKRRYWLTVVDIFSNHVWLEPLRNRERASVTKAFARVVADAPEPLTGTTVFCDREPAWTPEAYGDATLPFFAGMGVVQVFVQHAAHAEAAHKRIRETIRDAGFDYSAKGIRAALKSLNESPSRAIAGYTPAEALRSDDPSVVADIQEGRRTSLAKRERKNSPDVFAPGERVRVENEGYLVKRSRGDNVGKRVWLVDRSTPNYYHLIDPDGRASLKVKRELVRTA